MQPDLFQKPRRDSAAQGQTCAVQTASKLNNNHAKVILEYRQLNSPEARGVFADKWLRMMANNLEQIWGPFYELMDLVKKHKLYASADYMNGKTFESFGDFWKDVTTKPLQEWADLESTHHYIKDNVPHLLDKISYGKARNIVAAETKQGERTDLLDSNKLSQSTRAEENSVSRDTQIKLDKLASLRPDLLERVRAGELTAHGASVEAGFIKPPILIPDDPLKASKRLLKHFEGDELLTLIRELATKGFMCIYCDETEDFLALVAELADHAGFDIDLTPRGIEKTLQG